MSDGEDPKELGDILAKRSGLNAPPSCEPEYGLVVLLADRYGCTAEELAAEIDGPGKLAAIARDLLNWPAPERRAAGRPADEEESWRVYSHVEARRRDGVSIEVAIGELVSRDGSDAAEREFEKVKKRYQRTARRYQGLSFSDFLARAFAVR